MIRITGSSSAGPRWALCVRLRDMRAATAVCAALLAIAAMAATSGRVNAASSGSAPVYGPFGPEGPRLREQLWILPSADAGYPLRATVFRPHDVQGDEGAPARHPLVVINHGTSDATRMAVAMPVYYWLSRWFVERGYVVVLPQRRGHGATGGPMAEAIGSCADPDHYHSGLAAADDIEGAAEYMSAQPFVVPGETIVLGVSSGGWASLALASRNPANIRAVVNIAGGRGGRPFGQRIEAVCGETRLIEAARAFGHEAHVPTLWLYADNDSYFRPELARAMAAAWQQGGGEVELHVLPAYGSDGHNIADDRAGWDVWGPTIEHFLEGSRRAPVATLDPEKREISPQAANPIATAATEGVTRAP